MNTIEYNTENLKVYTNIGTSVEYFATAFACYLIYPDDLREKCPLTYQFYNRLINDLEVRYGIINEKTR